MNADLKFGSFAHYLCSIEGSGSVSGSVSVSVSVSVNVPKK
jgi:hypothetical protein